jgi:FkbM family methyltransferase
MFSSFYDGFTYKHNDPSFHAYITKGMSEPYPFDLGIVQKYMRMFPHKNRSYIDVGGHVGTTVMPFLKLFGFCVAYEPFSDNFNFLKQNVEANGMSSRCLLKNIGCSDKDRKGNMKMHFGGNSGCYYFEENESESDSSVRTIRIDDDSDVSGMEIDFIKIDAEGYELAILRGSENLLLRCKPLIQIETNEMSDKLFGVSKKDIINYLYSLGAREFCVNMGANTYFYFPNISLSIEPSTIYAFWTGTNQMSENRKNALSTIPNVRLITIDNLSDYILQAEPLHPAFQYLSETHKADYLRTYFMHFYGGGYTDIKVQQDSWTECFAKMKSGDHYACGYKESCGSDIAHPAYTQYWNELIGNCAYIVKPYTEFTHEWYKQMIEYLNSIYPILKLNKATFPQDCLERKTGYPIGWNHMLGRIFHPLVYKHRSKILLELKPLIFSNYR